MTSYSHFIVTLALFEIYTVMTIGLALLLAFRDRVGYYYISEFYR